MRLGGFSPLAASLGGGRPRVEVLYDSLNQALGSGYDTSDSSTVVAQTHAEARALDAVYAGNERMSYVMDPSRCPEEIIPRLEFIFNIHPHRTASIPSRRRLLAAHVLILGGNALLEDVVQAITGASFIGIEATALADAVPRWPVNGYPDKWTSNVAHFVVRVQFAPNQTNAEFWNMRFDLRKFLRDFVGAWVTFDIAILDSHGTGCFYLDEPDLDLETFCA